MLTPTVNETLAGGSPLSAAEASGFCEQLKVLVSMVKQLGTVEKLVASG